MILAQRDEFSAKEIAAKLSEFEPVSFVELKVGVF